ncbi:hypothetical protein [Streptomyces sp. 111WW2]|uniref:hypothetical protein n=1 Tax=Streptomyces sp. 111WW2 TaxID=1945515 RepID=UPI000D0C845C|nr:hypothetical protein [Streptomyces sp. 111WW2]
MLVYALDLASDEISPVESDYATTAQDTINALRRLTVDCAAVAPAPAQTPAEIRAQAYLDVAARLTAGCPDHDQYGGHLMTCQCEAVGLLQELATEAHQADVYPLALPWALLMGNEDLRSFLADVWRTTHGLYPRAGERPRTAREVLEAVEKAAATWRAVAETQHAHNTAPGPHVDDQHEDALPGCPGAAIDHDETGVCNHP